MANHCGVVPSTRDSFKPLGLNNSANGNLTVSDPSLPRCGQKHDSEKVPTEKLEALKKAITELGFKIKETPEGIRISEPNE